MMSRVPAISAGAFATLDLQLHARRPPARRHDRSATPFRCSPCRRRWSAFASCRRLTDLLGRAVLERGPQAAVAQCAHADAAHRRRLHWRPDRHGRASATCPTGSVRAERRGGRYFILVGSRQGAGTSPADRSARARSFRRQVAAHHQGGRRSHPGQVLGSADAQPANRPGARRSRPCRRGRGPALGVRLSPDHGLRPRALAGRAVLSARGRHQPISTG